MRHACVVPTALTCLAAAQGWVVSSEQCQHAGVPEGAIRGWCRQGRWVRVAHGIYAARPGDLDADGRRWAAVLAAGPGAALAGATAGALWGIADDGGAVEVLLPPGAQRRGAGPWTVRRTRIPFRTVGLLPRTTLERTALDLCRDDPDEAIGILTRAVNTRRTTAARIARELEGFARFPRRDLVRGVLGDIGEGALSHLEVRYLRRVERAHGLPRGERQHRGRAGLRDVRYGRLVVELDGRLGHTGTGRFRDMDRDNQHLLDGEVTLRFGHRDVEQQACRAASQVVRVLRLLGQPVDPVSCGARGCDLASSHPHSV